MLISLIICTLGERLSEFSRLIDSLGEQTFKEFEIIVVTQLNHSEISLILKRSNLNYKHIKVERKGLSFSRNIALKYVSAQYCTISDDDCWYPSDALEKVSTYLDGVNNVIAFKIFDPFAQLPYKDNYFEFVKKLNRFTISRVSSIELFFSSSLIKKGLLFDENFGLGAKYPTGEENIFLSDILTRKYAILYIPEYVVYHLRASKAKRELSFWRMKSVFMVFLRMYGLLGVCLYYVFYAKHFFEITNKFKSLFPFTV